MNSTSFKAGRIYNVVYTAEVPMVAQRQSNNFPLGFNDCNPLIDCKVSVRRVSTVQACGNETYKRMRLRKDPNWTPSDRPSWYKVDDANDCIVVHRTNGTRYLRALPIKTDKEEYFIGNVPATFNEVQTIRKFKKSQSEPDYVTIRLDNLANVDDTNARINADVTRALAKVFRAVV